MKRLFALLALMFLLVLLPTLVSSDASPLAATASSNPLTFVEAVFDTGLRALVTS